MKEPILSICLCACGPEYLQILLGGIEKNTEVRHEVCVHVNGDKGTQQWLLDRKQDNLKVSYSEENEGCAAVNHAVEMSEGMYVYNFNDDMYPLPGYDTLVLDLLKQGRNHVGIVSPGIIEPIEYYPEISNPIRFDAGQDAGSFDEDKLLKHWEEVCKTTKFVNTVDHMHPNCCLRALWDDVGGINKEYFPGWASDIQFVYDVYQGGGRAIQCGAARVYHFSGKTLQKDPERVKLCDAGVALFEKKTGMSIGEFQAQIGKGKTIDE